MTRAGADQDRAGARTRTAGLVGDRPGPALALAYQGTHGAILAILAAMSGDQLSTVVPACPDWTVRDLAAHMSGVAADTVEGRFPPINPHGTWAERQAVVDAHTASQVASRRAMTMAEVAGEWTTYLPRVLAVLRGDEPLPAGSMPAHDWVIVSDIAAHGQDLRGTLDLPGDRESAAETEPTCPPCSCAPRNGTTGPGPDRLRQPSPPACGSCSGPWAAAGAPARSSPFPGRETPSPI
jgi:uncharacterized protein (TIGR03083 family)